MQSQESGLEGVEREIQVQKDANPVLYILCYPCVDLPSDLSNNLALICAICELKAQFLVSNFFIIFNNEHNFEFTGSNLLHEPALRTICLICVECLPFVSVSLRSLRYRIRMSDGLAGILSRASKFRDNRRVLVLCLRGKNRRCR